MSGSPASDDLVVVAAPALLKEFTDDPVEPGATVTLRFTLTHDPNAPTAATDITFSDDLAATLSGLLATGLPASDVCGPGSQLSGTGNLTLSGGSLAPGDSCTFDVTLQVPTTAPAGSHSNTTSSVMATVAGVNAMENPAGDELKIAGLTLSKLFTDDPVLPGGTVTLRFTVDNISPTADATNITFSDNLDGALGGLTATGLPLTDVCGTGSSLIGLSGNSVLSLQGGNLAATTSCSFDVGLQVPAGAESDTYTNTTTGFSATVEGSTLFFDNAADELTVDANLLTLTKEFTNDPVPPGGSVDLRFTVTSLASESVENLSFTDDLGAALAGLTSLSGTVNDVCGTGSQVSGTSVLTLTGGQLAAGASCSFTVSLSVPVGVALGTVASNTTSGVTGTLGGLGVNGDAASDDLEIEFLELTKDFSGAAPVGGTVTLSFTLLNVGNVEATDLSFTDDLDAVLPGLAATGLPANDVCGLGSALTGTSVITFTGGSLLPSGSCTLSVVLQVPATAEPGSFVNTTSDLFLGESRGGDAASATLNVFEVPSGCPDRETIDYGGFTAADCASPQNAVTVFNQQELDSYLQDFGFDGSKVKNVKVKFDPTGDVVIVSPCEVLLRGDGGFLDVDADKVCLFGRKGVEVGGGVSAPGQGLSAQTLSLVSEEGSALVRQKLTINAGEVSAVALKEARIGHSCNVVVDGGPLSLVSEGDVPSSDAVIRESSVVDADTILLSASRTAKLGPSTQVSAADVLDLISTGAATGSLASLEKSAQVSAGTLNQTSGNKVKVGQNVVVDVVGNFKLNADGSCTVDPSATLNAGSTSGNCLP